MMSDDDFSQLKKKQTVFITHKQFKGKLQITSLKFEYLNFT